MARGWKRAAEWLLVRSGLPSARARGLAPAAAVLAYHNVVPAGEPPAGDLSLHVDQRDFAAQLDLLSERCDVVPLAEALAAPPAASRRPRVAITFDDAYRGALSAGLDELRRRDLPATVFVPPGLLGVPGFWWDLLAPPGGAPLPPDLRRHALEVLEGRQDRVLAWASEEGLSAPALPLHARPVDEKGLLEACSYGRLTLGAHTWSHPNLAVLDGAATEEELSRSKAWLRAKEATYIDWLAYPYGLRAAETVAAAAREFEGALLVDGGLACIRGRPTAPAHTTPRLNVPRGLTLEGLALRLAGLRR